MKFSNRSLELLKLQTVSLLYHLSLIRRLSLLHVCNCLLRRVIRLPLGFCFTRLKKCRSLHLTWQDLCWGPRPPLSLSAVPSSFSTPIFNWVSLKLDVQPQQRQAIGSIYFPLSTGFSLISSLPQGQTEHGVDPPSARCAPQSWDRSSCCWLFLSLCWCWGCSALAQSFLLFFIALYEVCVGPLLKFLKVPVCQTVF